MKQKAKNLTVLTLGLAASACIVGLFCIHINRAEALSTDTGFDTAAPDLSIDLDGYDAYSLPEGMVDVAYPVFGASA